MKKICVGTSLAAIAISIVPTSAAVVTLLDSSTISVQGGHLDGYEFPLSLVNPANPMTSLKISYTNNPLAPGSHPIVSTHVLFNPVDISSQSVTLNDSDHFETTLVFTNGITGINPSGGGGFGGPSNPGYFGFAAVHSGSNATTNLVWTAGYLDGSTAQGVGGIIPEPSVYGILAAVGILGLARRRRVAADRS